MPVFLHRFAAPILVVGLTAAFFLIAPSPSRAEVRKVTHVYKKAGDLEIKADVYREQDANKRPVVVWVHGGALIMGHRESVPGWLKDACLSLSLLAR